MITKRFTKIKAEKLLVYGIALNEYNWISICESTKEVWKCLKPAHERTIQVRESKVDMITTHMKLL